MMYAATCLQNSLVYIYRLCGHICICLYPSMPSDLTIIEMYFHILSKSFSVFAKDCYVKACARLDLYALTSAGNIRDYLRSHLRATYAPICAHMPTPLPTQATQGSSNKLFKSSQMQLLNMLVRVGLSIVNER